MMTRHPRPRRRLSLVLVLLALACATAPSAGCSKKTTATTTTPANPAVAWADEQPVSSSAVALHIKPPAPWVGVAKPVEARQAALDEAVRVVLFAHEAERRKLQPAAGSAEAVRASLVQKLIADELKARGRVPESISDDEAKAFYEQNRHRFNQPERFQLGDIVVESAELAEKLLGRAAQATNEAFAEMAREHRVDSDPRERSGTYGWVLASGKDERGNQLPMPLFRVARRLVLPGMVGLAQTADGRYHVLRAIATDVDYVPWDKDIMRIKNVMTREIRESLLDALDRSLREQHRIRVDQKALETLTVPAPDTP